jgi:predicted nucleic acid-binding protein
MKYLLDASALMLLIKKLDAKSSFEILQNSLILDLTFYEVGNAIWKETTLQKYLTLQETKKLPIVAQTILAKIQQIPSINEDFTKILEFAQSENLTFYDASYAYFAKQKALTLITEDKKLEIKSKKHIPVQTVQAFFKTDL